MCQYGALLTFRRDVFQIPVGMTSAKARYQAKMELRDAAIGLAVEMKLHIHLKSMRTTRKAGGEPSYTRRQLRHAATKWKRAALHRIRVSKREALSRRNRDDTDHRNKSGKYWVKEDWKSFLRAMQKTRRTAKKLTDTVLYNKPPKTSETRNRQRRAAKLKSRAKAESDRAAAQNLELPNIEGGIEQEEPKAKLAVKAMPRPKV